MFAAASVVADGALETIEVTGSRIPRRDFETASPIVSLSAQSFQTTSAISAERTLNQLPQFVPTVGATSVDPVTMDSRTYRCAEWACGRHSCCSRSPARTRGRVGISGSERDSARADPGRRGDDRRWLGRLRVDAIAGVVNIKLEDHFEGVELDGRWSQTTRDDGDEYDVGVTAGSSFAAQRGSVVGYVGYARREQIMQGERAFSQIPLGYYPDVTYGYGPHGAFLGTGGITDYGIYPVFPSDAEFTNVFAGYGYPPGTLPNPDGFGVNDDGSVFILGTGAPGAS